MKSKKVSVFTIIVSSIGIIVSEILVLMNNSQFAHEMSALSFIGLGIGAILIGIYQLIKGKNKGKE